ncbi:ABC transporter permease [Actinophytocola gossypii]|uniref:ABC transporter permease n=1 Tax=Actinophytocola gossypii TaxID=2812003 RepID=A0ABT2J213_9PSEU|nr:ABC transporter permease [Actinophytocola gossypii]MCT2581897.1 ABC transporter permease [Actinophytocola gossypii]
MSWNDSLGDATRYEIAQHGRNRVALALVVAFIPIWLTLVHMIIPSGPIAFHHDVTGRVVELDANQLSMISGAMNAVTLIIGFMMFSAVRRSSDFDRRLVLAGYARSALLVAKLLALGLAAAVVSLYATSVLMLFWMPELLVPFYLSLVLSGLTYGGIGILLGVVFRTELAGMFLIIMISLVDVMVQNPIITPSTGVDGFSLLPTYGAMQNSVGAAFTGDLSLGYFLLGMLWLAGAALIGLVAFHRRTRDHIGRQDPSVPRQQPERTATVVVSVTADGSLRIRSSSGPVLVCSCATDESREARPAVPAEARPDVRTTVLTTDRT